MEKCASPILPLSSVSFIYDSKVSITNFLSKYWWYVSLIVATWIQNRSWCLGEEEGRRLKSTIVALWFTHLGGGGGVNVLCTILTPHTSYDHHYHTATTTTSTTQPLSHNCGPLSLGHTHTHTHTHTHSAHSPQPKIGSSC